MSGDARGGNSILLFGGANETVTEAMADAVPAHFSAEDVLVVQNEISCVAYLIAAAHARAAAEAFSAAQG